MTKKIVTFLDSFPDHQYRYIDQTGNGRPPLSSLTVRGDLNLLGFEAYFTVNGFKDTPNAQRENCTSLNAFFVDIDGRKDLEELETIKKKLDPTYILETMNGYHIYWCLDEPIYKAETPNWDGIVEKWEMIEQSLVTALKGDDKAKDLCRILRQPNTYYWKKSGDAYKKGTEGVFKIKGVYKNLASNYSMRQVEEVFPIIEPKQKLSSRSKAYAEAERKDFFNKVNNIYPIEERPSFQTLVTGKGNLTTGERNHALHIIVTQMRDAGWNYNSIISHFQKVGWYGTETERGGWNEMQSTIKSGFEGGYHYSYKEDVIAKHMTEEEQIEIQNAFNGVLKERKEKDKLRFGTYEKEILNRYPHLKKNEIGLVFNYENGVYKLINDLEIEGIIFRALDEDMLWNFRTNKNISDKLQCLLSIIPDLKITDDKGEILNLKNGLLNIFTKELKPHTPDFISLVQFPVTYDQNALCPVWDKCLDDWMEGLEKEEKKLLLQQFAGYVLSSEMLYDRALFLVGDGANGKSTFVDTLAMIVGHNAVSHIDLEGLYSQFGMKGLIGKRLNIIEEVHNNYYQANKLKKLVSGEPQTIDIKHKDQFAFRPQTKFIFAVNLMPRVDDTSVATERRTCVVLFGNNFRASPKINLRGSRGLLAQELSGILNWMIEGSVKLKEAGAFIVTKEQLKVLEEYRQENSSVEGFIAECLEYKEGVSTSSPDLYSEYKKFCITNGMKPKGCMTFTKEMKAYGNRHSKFSFVSRSYGKAQACFEGVMINNSWSKESVAEHEYRTEW
jgi:putative DNA primase/helicase